MMRRSARDWLSDVISWGERLQAHLARIDRGAFFANPLIQDAVSKCVEAIGEAAGKLDDLNPELDRTVPDHDFSSWPGLSRPSTSCFLRCKDVDARDKPGHDEW